MAIKERLTHKRNNGIKQGFWTDKKKDELTQRLGEYEDTGYLPEEINVNLSAHMENVYSVKYYVGGEVKEGLLPVGADLQFYANVTEIDGTPIQGWGDVNCVEYTTMPAHDVTIYGSYTSGIAEIIMDSANVRMYNINGKRIYKLQRGINIIINKDGKIRKVNIKQ